MLLHCWAQCTVNESQMLEGLRSDTEDGIKGPAWSPTAAQSGPGTRAPQLGAWGWASGVLWSLKLYIRSPVHFPREKSYNFHEIFQKVNKSLNKILQHSRGVNAFRTLTSYRTDARHDHFKGIPWHSRGFWCRRQQQSTGWASCEISNFFRFAVMNNDEPVSDMMLRASRTGHNLTRNP